MPSTRVIAVDPHQPDPRVIAEAARLVRAGWLVAFATETVYGLGADATNPEAVSRIFEAKGRPSTNPLIVHVHDQASARRCVASWPDRAEVLARRFWPGPLTLVLPRSKIIPDIVTAGQETVGVRVPDLGVARSLILESGRPIAAPSANRSLGVSPTRARHVLEDLDGKVDLILDSGPTTIGIESTVLDLSAECPKILRPGQITLEEIAGVLGEEVESGGPTLGQARSPGQMAVHYAPSTPAYLMERSQIIPGVLLGSFALLVLGENDGTALPASWTLTRPPCFELSGPDEASRHLYARLREIDALGLDFLVVVGPPDEPRWRAIRDRIGRATQPWNWEDPPASMMGLHA